MQYFNTGYIIVDEKDTEKIIEEMINLKIIDSKDEIEKKEVDNHIKLNIGSYLECQGDIENDLFKLCIFAELNNIIINGQIHYDGSYEGVYEIVDNKFTQYDYDTWILKEASKDVTISQKLKDLIFQEINSNESDKEKIKKIEEYIEKATVYGND